MDLGSLEDDHTIQTISVRQKKKKFHCCGKVHSCAKWGRETHSARVLLDLSS